MNVHKIFIIGVFVIFLHGCASKGAETVSITEANQLALKLSQLPYTPPKRSINYIRDYYKDYQLETNSNCEKDGQLFTDKRNDLLSQVSSANTRHDAVSSIAFLSEQEFLRGNFDEAIDISTRAYRLLPDYGESVKKGLLASSIGRMYAKIGTNYKARSWFGITFRLTSW